MCFFDMSTLRLSEFWPASAHQSRGGLVGRGRGLGPPACEMAARAGAMAMREKGQQVRRGLLASFRRSVLAFLTQHARSLGRARARAMLAGGEADSRRQSKTSKSND